MNHDKERATFFRVSCFGQNSTFNVDAFAIQELSDIEATCAVWAPPSTRLTGIKARRPTAACRRPTTTRAACRRLVWSMQPGWKRGGCTVVAEE